MPGSRGHLPRADEVLALNDFDSIRVAYTEGAPLDDTTKLWEADQGTATVTERTATTLTMPRGFRERWFPRQPRTR